MRSKVYFTGVNDKETIDIVKQKLKNLIDKSGLLNDITPGSSGVVKIHFGEEGNKGFVRPEYVKVIVDKIKEKSVDPVISDTNTLYKGKRTNSEDHTALAYEHGFTFDNTGGEILIPENIKENNKQVPAAGNFIKEAKIVKLFSETDILINVAHFKGHMMTGFGGALKNIGMGCASREGKLEQHTDFTPAVFSGNCIGCGRCVEVCPADALEINSGKAVLDKDKCIGCAECMAACPTGAVSVNWEEGAGNIQEKMVEYAKAVLDSRKGKTIHMNFAIKITRECDCLAKDDPCIVPDIGIFISLDPVSLDKACYDAAVERAGKDIFKEVHPGRDGMRQLDHAVKIGLGNMGYELIGIDADR